MFEKVLSSKEGKHTNRSICEATENNTYVINLETGLMVIFMNRLLYGTNIKMVYIFKNYYETDRRFGSLFKSQSEVIIILIQVIKNLPSL